MILAFTLSMPNVGSWNGKWTGAANIYARTRNIGSSKKAAERVAPILAKGHFYYNFGDGWGANVNVEAVDAKTSAKLNRASKGFCGYEWMIDSILERGEIKSPSEIKALVQEANKEIA